jgi:hypothetical protein
MFLSTAQIISYVGSSAVRSASARHTDSVVYGDEVISVEDELKYPYPHEQLLLFSTGVGVKGPLFNRTYIPNSFEKVHIKGHAPLNHLVSGLNNRPSFILGFSMTAERYFLMSSWTSLL